MKKKAFENIRYKIFLFITVFGLVFLITGTSYAILNGNVNAENEQIVEAGSVKLKLTEKYDNISKKSFVMSDENGLIQEEYYSFNIKNIGNANAKYDLKLINEAPSDYAGDILDDKYIKIGLEINDVEYGPFTLSEVNNVIDSDIIYENEIVNYVLRIWLDEEYQDELVNMENFKSFLKLNVEAIQRDELVNLDRSGANEPILSDNMIPVYYDDETKVWRKADYTNTSEEYKWYDYDNQMWANVVTVGETMEATGNVSDYSGNNLTASIVGAPVYSQEGLVLDGNDDGLYLDDNLSDFFNGTSTFQIKVKRTETNVRDILMGNYSNVAGDMSFEIYSDNMYRVWFDNGASSLKGGSSIYNEFVLITYVFDKTNNEIRVYEDDNLNYTFSYNGYGSFSGNFDNVYIGRDSRTGATSLKGTIERVMIYDKALSVSEIKSNINTSSKAVGVSNNGVVSDNLLLYYDFRDEVSRSKFTGAKLGTEIPMDMINTMFVWIPRYKYTVWNYNLSGNVSSDISEIELSFEKGSVSTGAISCSDDISGSSGSVSEVCKLKKTNSVCTDGTCNGKTYTHPAFTFGDDELTGIWVAKFETSSDGNCTVSSAVSVGTGCNVTNMNPIIKPNVSSWRGAMIGTNYFNILSMNDASNIYGFNDVVDTHMMKSSEWGAVSYLTMSKYGKYGNNMYTGDNKEIYQNKSSTYITGSSNGGPSSDIVNTQCAYNDLTDRGNGTGSCGGGASTTGNIYGIYDMSGGSWEQVMSAMVSSGSTDLLVGQRAKSSTEEWHSGFSGLHYKSSNGNSFYVNYNGNYALPSDSKYYDKYSFGETYNDDFSIKRSKLGEGIREVWMKVDSSWYSDLARFPFPSDSWIYRGGGVEEGAIAGLFYSIYGAGSADPDDASRVVLSISK